MPDVDFRFPARLIAGPGGLERIAASIRDLGATRAFLVSDASENSVAQTARAVATLRRDNIEVEQTTVTGPATAQVIARAAADARTRAPGVIIGLGTDAALDIAKAVSVLATNDGSILDYRGEVRLKSNALPALAVPTIGSAGADARRSVAVVDPSSVNPVACGAAGISFTVVVIDPELSVGVQPAARASAAFHAMAHAIEAWVSQRRTLLSDLFAREAWRLLASSSVDALSGPDISAIGTVQLGSFLAGLAADQSALGAGSACARPVSRRYGVAEGVALALLLPEVVRWNSRAAGDRYAELAAVRGELRRPETLVARLEDFVAAGNFPASLAAAGVIERDLPALAVEASAEEAGSFNPRPFDVAGALEIYAAAY